LSSASVYTFSGGVAGIADCRMSNADRERFVARVIR